MRQLPQLTRVQGILRIEVQNFFRVRLTLTNPGVAFHQGYLFIQPSHVDKHHHFYAFPLEEITEIHMGLKTLWMEDIFYWDDDGKFQRERIELS